METPRLLRSDSKKPFTNEESLKGNGRREEGEGRGTGREEEVRGGAGREEKEEAGVVAFLSHPKCHDFSEYWLQTHETTETHKVVVAVKWLTQDTQLVS